MSASGPSCKICGAATIPFGDADFNRTCEDHRGPVFEPAGWPIRYVRCGRCGLIFTSDFDTWTAADFAARIYNHDYVRADPDYAGKRPLALARTVQTAFGHVAERLRVLDYGGGDGRLAEVLRGGGFRACEVYDPFDPRHDARPMGRFDLVTCFEVMEHACDPIALMSDLLACLAPEGLLLFSTLLQPSDIAELGMAWWYIGPRNGHVTLHSTGSLTRLMGERGLQWVSFNDNVHAAFRTRPAFAEALLARARPAPGLTPAAPAISS